MKDLICDEFQYVVGDLLIRHHSVLDVLTKLSEANSRVNRAVVKAVTECGCVSIEAAKLQIPENIQSIEELKDHLDSHLRGKLCTNCEEIIMNELGKMLFYTAALCNTLDINLYDVFINEYSKASTLGVYNLR
jgi:NTP pyrophosphatase (non-canonical NTP hydrolase)